MSTKHLRNQLRSIELEKSSKCTTAADEKSNSSSDENGDELPTTQKNAFELLASENEDAECSDAEVCTAAKSVAASQPSATKRKKKNKKKRANNNKNSDAAQKSITNNPNKDENDSDQFDAILAEFGAKEEGSKLQLIQDQTGGGEQNDLAMFNTTELMKVNVRQLNPDHEMRAILGARFRINDAAASASHQRRTRTQGKLVKPKNSWQPMKASGLSMSYSGVQSDGTKLFVFEHNQSYKEAQLKFWMAADAMNPDAFVHILREHPWHVDTLLQLASVMRTNEDYQAARDLVERAVYACECAFHSLYNISTADCRLDYRQWENRPFFLALFRHVLNLCQRSCYKTALEFCKMLYGLAPAADPLCSLMLIDYVALKARRYDFLLSLAAPLDTSRNISQLPNFAYSIALAHFLKYQDQDTSDGQLLLADQALQLAIRKFPTLVIPLLDKCQVQVDKDVESCRMFSLTERMADGKGLQQLIALYVARCQELWVQPAVLSWLETNVRALLPVLNQSDNHDQLLTDFALRRRQRYAHTPRSVLRHLLLSDLGVGMLQPPDTNTLGFDYDPVPPSDGQATYTRPLRQAVRGQDGILAAFLRSLMPNYDHEATAEAQAAALAAGVDEQNDAGNLQRALQAVREMMNGIQFELPDAAAQPEDDDFNAQDWQDDFD